MKTDKTIDNSFNYGKIEEFLQNTIYFENFPLSSVSKIAANCFLKEISFNSSFLTSSELTSEIYFIYEGSLNLIKKYKSENYVISNLEKGFSLGIERYYLSNKNLPYSFFAPKAVKLIGIKTKIFLTLIPEYLLQIYLENFDNFPDDENLEEMIKINLEWSKFKENAIHNVKASKQNKKNEPRKELIRRKLGEDYSKQISPLKH